MNIKILIAAHKNYFFPKDCYYPVNVGYLINQRNFCSLNDAMGENISLKNPMFCELTALYWAWKNQFLDSQYIGLVHYRRYFVCSDRSWKRNHIGTGKQFLSILEKYDCILPKKRNYYITTIYNHYKNSHYIKDLDITRDIIKEKYPKYLSSFDKVLNSKELHLYNMFIMSTKHTNEYCEWLFNILFSLEEKINASLYDSYQQRVFGFIAERLLNVWVLENNLRIKELKVINIEKDNIFRKISIFLYRNFLKNRILK